jgi:hypothetical protein
MSVVSFYLPRQTDCSTSSTPVITTAANVMHRIICRHKQLKEGIDLAACSVCLTLGSRAEFATRLPSQFDGGKTGLRHIL